MTGECGRALTGEQPDGFSYLILPAFYDPDETSAMLGQARKLLDDFRIEGHPLVSLNSTCLYRGRLRSQTAFKTEADGEHVGDEYFLNSGDKVGVSPSLTGVSWQIRYFLEPSALSPATSLASAKLLVPSSQSINKIGHALAILDPVFRKHTLDSDKMRGVARDLGEFDEARVLQSMVICKQPRIGGQGGCYEPLIIASVMRAEGQCRAIMTRRSCTPIRPLRSARGSRWRSAHPPMAVSYVAPA